MGHSEGLGQYTSLNTSNKLITSYINRAFQCTEFPMCISETLSGLNSTNSSKQVLY